MIREFYFAQKAFIEDDGKILLVQKSMADPNQPGKWEVPGGRFEFGERVDEQIIREVKEEVGLDILPGPPFYIWEWQLQRRTDRGPVEMQIVAVARVCKLKGGAATLDGNAPNDYLRHWAWVPVDQVFSYDLIENTKPVLHEYLGMRQSGKL